MMSKEKLRNGAVTARKKTVKGTRTAIHKLRSNSLKITKGNTHHQWQSLNKNYAMADG